MALRFGASVGGHLKSRVSSRSWRLLELLRRTPETKVGPAWRLSTRLDALLGECKARRILSAWPRQLHPIGPVQSWGLVAQMYSVETANAAYPLDLGGSTERVRLLVGDRPKVFVDGFPRAEWVVGDGEGVHAGSHCDVALS